MKKPLLPDILGEKIDIIFCGMAPGRISYMMRHYYANPTNRFWWALREAGFTQRQIVPTLDPEKRNANYELLKSKKIGLTDIVKYDFGNDIDVRVNDEDIKRLTKLILKHQPKILAFNGKKPAQLYFKLPSTKKLNIGELKNVKIGRTKVFVLPSTSAVAKSFWQTNPWRDVRNALKRIKNG